MARILVADDEASLRAVIKKALTTAGHTVDEVDDGRAVLELYTREPRDLLLLDLYMPGMDGLETMKRLLSQHPRARIVAMSGGGFRHKHDVLALAAQAGAAGTLAKPFELDALLAAVRAALGPGELDRTIAPEPASPKGTVLVVEDDARTRGLLCNRLRAAGYAVVEVYTAEAALEQYRTRPLDALIADLVLPRKSGADLIATLRREGARVGIIAISGEPDRLAALGDEAGTSSGFRTLPKPFTTEQLLAALEAVLAERLAPRRATGSWLGAALTGLRRTLAGLWRS